MALAKGILIQKPDSPLGTMHNLSLCGRSDHSTTLISFYSKIVERHGIFWIPQNRLGFSLENI